MRKLKLLRKKVLAEVLNFLRQHDARITDHFPIDVTDAYIEFVEEAGRLPAPDEFARSASKVKTKFYRENHRLGKTTILQGIARELETTLRDSREIEALLAARHRVFVSHSSIFPDILKHFTDVIQSAGYKPTVAETTPNYGRSWAPGQKVRTLMKRCVAVTVILTPDDPRTGFPIPNVIHEIGLAQGLVIPIVYLKAKGTNLPSNINPVYISFRMERPDDADRDLMSNLHSLDK